MIYEVTMEKRDLIDLIKSIRQLKSQIAIARGLELTDDETKIIEDALIDLKKEIDKEN